MTWKRLAGLWAGRRGTKRGFDARWEAGSYRCSFLAPAVPTCSIAMALLGSVVLAVVGLLAHTCVTGGALPMLGMILIAAPVAVISALALVTDVKGMLARTEIAIEGDRMIVRPARSFRRQVLSTRGLRVESRDGAVAVRDADGITTGWIWAIDASLVARQLDHALATARAPRTYRG